MRNIQRLVLMRFEADGEGAGTPREHSDALFIEVFLNG
tara:strand:+ start:68 stop:181 length:114 start_codon:yes stop_codon:yes gene_type:complete